MASAAPLSAPVAAPVRASRRPSKGTFIIGAVILVLGAYLLYPIILLLVLSLNTAKDVLVGPATWGLDNWSKALANPRIVSSLFNSFLIWFLVAAVSFPIAITISLILARTRIPFSRGLEFGFWIAFIFPTIASTLGWMMMLSPSWGLLNLAAIQLPFVDAPGPFNIYSVPGIVWVRLMADGIAFKVILLTPAFRNMNGALEEAGRVSGASNIKTMLKITLPVMIAPIALVLALQLIKVFQGFEVEWLLGSRFGFFVFPTLIYSMVRLQAIPQYGQAIVLATATLLLIAVIIPIQRWILGRRLYTTIGSSYRPGLIDLGRWKWIAFSLIAGLLFLLTILPTLVLLFGSFMRRVGFFNTTELFTLRHWDFVFHDGSFIEAVRTTLFLATAAGLISPILFSLVAYILVRTRWRGRALLDSIVWGAASMPGILLGLGLLLMFLTTPGLRALFGTIWPLVIVVVLAGITTGVNVFKGVLVQLGKELEEAGRVSGAGWIRTYFKIVLPVLMPTMVLVGMLNFVSAAGATSSVVLLSSRETTTLSILALQYGSGAGAGGLEPAGIVSLLIMALTLGLALPLRMLALRMGINEDDQAGGNH